MATIYPFRQEARRIDEETTSYVGMVVFLASWALMFASMFFAYAYLRLKAPHWPPVGFPHLPLFMPGLATIVLLISSVTLHKGVVLNRQKESSDSVKNFLDLTLLLGGVFLALQVYSWVDLWQQGLRLQTGTYGALFYVLTAFHALHVLCGIVILVYLARLSRKKQLGPKRHTKLLLTSMFWHFVDVVWVAMFALVYLI